MASEPEKDKEQKPEQEQISQKLPKEQQPTAEQPEKKPAKPRKPMRPIIPLSLIEKVKNGLRETAIVLGSFLVLNSFVLASFEVPTGSMENEIMTGDFLLVNKFVYGGTTPRTIPFTNVKIPAFKLPMWWPVERGDIIVFVFPGQREEVEPAEFAYYLKRAMALSGDTLRIVNRVVYINGKPAPIPRGIKFNSKNILPAGVGNPRIFPKGAPFNEDNYGPIVVPRKGDVITLTPENFPHWNIFIAREGHTVERSGQKILIDGTETSKYAVEREYAFGMGDNRDNSLDSRFWGYIPQESIVGSPLIVYWSWDPDIPLFSVLEKLGSVRWTRIGALVR